ncbi:MAG: integrase core domain-containing protein, partial [Clostridia bacterium]|nr:integrase core domain-containing protein [Clostridia bacterium]
EQYGFRISMSRPGTPSDNQPIESFWKTLKTEITDIRHLGYEEAKQEILSYIYLYYNSERLHLGIGYKTPNSVWM